MKAIYKVAATFEELGLINPFFILSMRAKSDELIEVAESLLSSELKVYLNGLNDLSSSLALKKCTPLVTAIMLGNMRLATWFVNHSPYADMLKKNILKVQYFLLATEKICLMIFLTSTLTI